MATFDFDFEGICKGDALAIADMLDQIQTAFAEWQALLSGSIQLNQDYEPSSGNFATAWLNADPDNTLPIPDKIMFTWVSSEGLSGEYMAWNGVVTRLENEYYSGRAIVRVLDTDNFPVSVDTNDGPNAGQMTGIVTPRPATLFAHGIVSIGRSAGGAFTGDKMQVNAQFGAAPVTGTPVGVIQTFPVQAPGGTGPFYRVAAFHHIAEILAAGTWDLRVETYTANAVTAFTNGGHMGTNMLPVNASAPENTTVDFYYYDEVIYGSDI